jgi:hypothetical protein
LESSPEGFIHEVITPSPGSRNAPIADVKDISHFQENDQGKTSVNAADYLIFFFFGIFCYTFHIFNCFPAFLQFGSIHHFLFYTFLGHGVNVIGEGLISTVSAYGELSSSPELERGQGFVKVGFSKTPDVRMHGMCFVIFSIRK